ncbi:hypothetical protein O6H91_10G056800 [Diphasiastrum complanatum]|uniref:Uncharacterized protein n=2 Tax=Diphasiastrum complanatum TaxID=34168 RepID=A0ACC2CHF6_DIPCM|nr:hypothetical protein O6H91_10G056800 [Diphasiastrum complanatum]KAJ7541370.1 hypothetical protein O6H91_10G056800 [Diphasiastrum complanatum]
MQSPHNDSSLNAEKSDDHSRHHSHNGLVLGFAIAGCSIVILAIILVCYFVYHKLKTRRTSPYDLNSIKLQRFSYQQLKAATNGFSNANKLGQGGFGAVYKGVLRNGQEVAVKKMDTTSLQGEREFQNEVMVIGNISLPYIVSLLGFCVDRKRRLLVYEYMENGSLQEALFDEDNPVTLDWRTRFKIILDVAQSLAFLHLNCDPPIIHGDVKPSNILLDSTFSARIADFGLARLKTEVTGNEVRSEDIEGYMMEQERIRHERMAREKERRKLRRKAETKKADASNEDKSGEKLLELPKQEVSRKLQTSTEGGEERASPETEGSPLNCLAESQNFPEQGREFAIQIGDDGWEPAIRHKDDSSAFDALTITQDLQKNTDEKINASLPNSSHASEEQDDIIRKSSPVDEGLHENQQVNAPGSGSGSSEQKEAKEKGVKTQGWRRKQDGDENIRDYTVDWSACEVRRGQSSNKDWNWKEETHLEKESRSNDKKNGWRGRPMSLEWWGQCLREKSCKDMDRKRRRSKSKESNRGWWKEDPSCEISGEKSKEWKKGEAIKEQTQEIREWWREDYSAELSKKSKESKKLDKSHKDSRINRMSRNSWSFDLSGDLYQQGRGAHDRQHESSRTKEWSGDLLSWNRSRDSARIEFSGEITGHIKDARLQQGRRERSHSRDWWSGDVSGRALSSTSSMRGTVCYVAPEYGGGGILTEKSDVYSFGVLMLVIISGRRPLQVVASPAEFDRANLISWARNLAQTGNVLDLVDAAMQGEYSTEQALLCITLAILCLQRLPAVRPTMGEVVKILSGEIQLPAFPFEFSPSPSSGHSALSLQAKRKPTSESVTVELPLLA